MKGDAAVFPGVSLIGSVIVLTGQGKAEHSVKFCVRLERLRFHNELRYLVGSHDHELYFKVLLADKNKTARRNVYWCKI